VNEAATVAHLTPRAYEFLQEPDERRIRAILGERWVPYPRAKLALDVLNRVVAHPRTTRMPSVAIYGDSGMGKTMIMQRFCADHPACFDFEAGIERTPVLALQMSGKPGERRLYAQLLAALGAPPGPRASVVDLEQAALRLMRTIGVQVLVIDEVQHSGRLLPRAEGRTQHAPVPQQRAAAIAGMLRGRGRARGDQRRCAACPALR
jgi:hypothetical protein